MGNHIADLEANLEALRDRLSPEEIERLRVLVHVHDTFKPQSIEEVNILHPQSHASLARAFLAEFTDDAELLNQVQFHDEGYALWRQSLRGKYNHERLERLLNTIRDWDQFLAFVVIDGCTEGKSREPLRWFLGLVGPRVGSRVDESWIL